MTTPIMGQFLIPMLKHHMANYSLQNLKCLALAVLDIF